MRGRKKAVWAVVICVAFITAGLILSCGDDDDAVVSPSLCQPICERFEEYEWIPGDFGNTVADCVDGCEQGEEEPDKEFLECIVDTPCETMMEVCLMEMFCQTACEKFDDCGWIPDGFGDTVADCVDGCKLDAEIEGLMCIFDAETCDDIVADCF